jgi:acylphosphatase
VNGQVIRRVVVRGTVQGVGYRAFVEDQAALNGIEGWVRNRRDGTVEAVFAGANATVAAIVEICRRGPETAHVETLEVFDASENELGLRRPGEHFSTLLTT